MLFRCFGSAVPRDCVKQRGGQAWLAQHIMQWRNDEPLGKSAILRGCQLTCACRCQPLQGLYAKAPGYLLSQLVAAHHIMGQLLT